MLANINDSGASQEKFKGYKIEKNIVMKQKITLRAKSDFYTYSYDFFKLT